MGMRSDWSVVRYQEIEAGGLASARQSNSTTSMREAAMVVCVESRITGASDVDEMGKDDNLQTLILLTNSEEPGSSPLSVHLLT